MPAQRILVVDDSVVVRRLHAYILQGEGFETCEAGNGFEALEVLARSPCALALVDVNMPKMDGLTLTREIRAHPEWQAMPIIIVSTQQEARDLLKGRQAGASIYLVKPADPDALIATVHQLLAPPPTPAGDTDKLEASQPVIKPFPDRRKTEN
jgi:two-component system, chemotaxis family, chemotaxis protein CheY